MNCTFSFFNTTHKYVITHTTFETPRIKVYIKSIPIFIVNKLT